jgi:hypothetical protein
MQQNNRSSLYLHGLFVVIVSAISKEIVPILVIQIILV